MTQGGPEISKPTSDSGGTLTGPNVPRQAARMQASQWSADTGRRTMWPRACDGTGTRPRRSLASGRGREFCTCHLCKGQHQYHKSPGKQAAVKVSSLNSSHKWIKYLFLMF